MYLTRFRCSPSSQAIIIVMSQGVVAEIPGANIKEFLVTILSEANSRMVKNSFQRAEWYLGNSLSGFENWR
jgi:hypothetical protein